MKKGREAANWHTEAEVAEIVAERIPGFEYAGNYTGMDGNADIRCKACGAVMTRSFVTIRHSNVRCRVCERNRIAERNRQKKAAAEEAMRQREAERLRRNTKPTYTFICAECGETFIATTKSRVCCSPECARHRQNRKPDRRLKRTNQKTNGITIARLYKRDKGICYICGKECDWNDKTERDGTIICGDNYPSIEHVIPLSCGGPNEWDNVKLACRGCNTRKRDHSLTRILEDGRLAINL